MRISSLFWSPELDLWRVKIDPRQVDQILANLVVNARDAIPGVGAITMRTENVVIDDSHREDIPEFIPGEYVLLTVSDTGAVWVRKSRSISSSLSSPPRRWAREPGWDCPPFTASSNKMTVLSMSYSEPGKGTTFKIYLPRFEAETAEVLPEEAAAGKQPTGTETILIVEDDEAILSLSTTVLEKLGYKVLAAPAPRHAIRLVNEHRGDVHLLITDVVMPEMNGRELAEKLNAIRPNLKCLYMSGYTADLIAHRGILDERVNFIRKPFGSSDFAARVRQVLDHPEQTH